MEELEKKNRYNSLLMMYSECLSAFQKADLNDYYGRDMSLGEIAASRKVSRNAIYISIKQGEKVLDRLEERLKFFQKITLLDKRLTALKREDNIDKIKKEIANISEDLKNGI